MGAGLSPVHFQFALLDGFHRGDQVHQGGLGDFSPILLAGHGVGPDRVKPKFPLIRLGREGKRVLMDLFEIPALEDIVVMGAFKGLPVTGSEEKRKNHKKKKREKGQGRGEL
jgi:hypothetical protein